MDYQKKKTSLLSIMVKNVRSITSKSIVQQNDECIKKATAANIFLRVKVTTIEKLFLNIKLNVLPYLYEFPCILTYYNLVYGFKSLRIQANFLANPLHM